MWIHRLKLLKIQWKCGLLWTRLLYFRFLKTGNFYQLFKKAVYYEWISYSNTNEGVWSRYILSKLYWLNALSNLIHYTSDVWRACVEPGGCEVHFQCYNTPIIYVTVNTKNSFHVNTIFTRKTINAILHATRKTLLSELAYSRCLELIGSRGHVIVDAQKMPSFV